MLLHWRTRAQLDCRKTELPGTEEIKRYIEDLRSFLEKEELPERGHFIRSFVREVRVFRGEVTLTYTIPMAPNGLKTEWASVLFTIRSGDPDRIKDRTFSVRFSLSL